MPRLFKIQSNIPVPSTPADHTPLYPLNKLKVGQSFFVPSSFRSADVVRHCVWSYAKRRGLNQKFSTRSVEGGLRVWRIK